MFYGWAWKFDYLMEYAIRHRLTYRSYSGDFKLNYSILGEPGFCKEDFKHYRLLEGSVTLVVERHLEALCGFSLSTEPLEVDREYDGMFALYSNRTYRNVDWLMRSGYEQFMRSLTVIHTAMNEKGHKSDLLWFHCQDKYA